MNLTDLHALDIEVMMRNGDLVLRTAAPGVLTPALTEQVRQHKAALIAALSARDSSVPAAWWRLHYPDRGWREVCFAPTVSRAEALLLHRDATDAVPGWD